MYDNYFYLLDLEEEHNIVVYCSPWLFQNISSGEQVYVSAKFDYDKENLRYCLQVDGEIHDILVTEWK